MRVLKQGGGFKRFLHRRKDFKLEEKIDNGVRKAQLSLTYPLEDGRILCQELLDYDGEVYVVRESQMKGITGSIVAEQYTDDLEGTTVTSFDASDTVTGVIGQALTGTGWTYQNVSCSDQVTRTISENNTNVFSILEVIAETFFVEIALSAEERKVYLYNKIGNQGSKAKLIRGFNLKTLEMKSDTNDFYTCMLPIGKDDLTIESVNDGDKYIYNFQYSTAKKAMIWEDTNYEDAASLMKAAKQKLEEISTPAVNYTATILDVANMADGYEDFAFQIGDAVDILDPELEISDRQRIVKITRYPDKPEKNTVELSNRKMSFSDLQKKLLAAANTVSNVTSGNMITISKVSGLEASETSSISVSTIGDICT